MREAKITGAALAALLVAVAPATGQVQLVPKVGFYTPAADLEAAAAATGEIAEDRGGSLAVGLAVELGARLSPLSFRAGFDYVTGSEFTYEDDASVESTGEQTMLALAADVVLRPIPRLLIVQPYLLAGAGVKRYDFSFREDATADAEAAFPDDETDFTVHAGVGLDLGLGPIAVLVEASDYVSWYEAPGADGSDMQHDIFVMAGVRVGLF